MPRPAFIGPLPGATPADLKLSRGQQRPLPDDLLREASRRLGILSLLGAALWIIGTVMGHVAAGALNIGDRPWTQLQSIDAVAASSVFMSLGLFAYTRRPNNDPRFVLDIGLLYMMLTATALALSLHWFPVPTGIPVIPGISWSGAVVLMFAAIVPNAPWKVFVTGLIAVSMNPISMLIAGSRGIWDFGPPINALLMHYPDVLLVGVAVVVSQVVTKLGQHVTKARELGSYRIGELLGRGGMGEVYRATHSMLARPAAIKLIRPEVLTAEDGDSAQLALMRFRREAKAAASLRSPHTVQLYDFGVTEDETLYFVMELLEGMDLESLVRQYGPVAPARVIYILRQVCESLEEAHATGLIHRDIKPENIHVGQLGGRHDFVKVLDFGLAKKVLDKTDEYPMQTAVGLTPGTPAYMAPEMALGEAVDHRADLYALGCVAYYLLTAELVFRADNAVRLLAKHLQAEPTPPSRLMDSYMPAAFDKLVLACLAKDPAARPQSAAAVDHLLAAVELKPWDEEQAARWWHVNENGRVEQESPSPAGAAR